MKPKLDYIFLGIIILLTATILWFVFDYSSQPSTQSIPKNDEKMVEAINILNQKLNILEAFLTMEFPKEVEEYKTKTQQ